MILSKWPQMDSWLVSLHRARKNDRLLYFTCRDQSLCGEYMDSEKEEKKTKNIRSPDTCRHGLLPNQLNRHKIRHAVSLWFSKSKPILPLAAKNCKEKDNWWAWKRLNYLASRQPGRISQRAFLIFLSQKTWVCLDLKMCFLRRFTPLALLL